MLSAVEFFAGSGLVRLGLEPDFQTVWANDISAKKRDTYKANFGDKTFLLESIENVSGQQIPSSDLAWASFPCQDLSLAGNMSGMSKGTRSGLFWEWIRILWELRALGKCPSVLAVENVLGFVVADQGAPFREAYNALRELGYKVGGVVINASHFVPQSRPRVFLVAVRDGISLDGLTQTAPKAPFHPKALVQTVRCIDDSGWVWWSLPSPRALPPVFSEICETGVSGGSQEDTSHLLKMLSPAHRRKLEGLVASGGTFAATGYRRTRKDEWGNSAQRLELRFDGVAGCLRTPDGGSSRQTVILVQRGKVTSRLLTPRECARLMGAPDSFKLPGTYNDAYRAMGDGVAVPVTRWLSKNLLRVLALRASGYLQVEKAAAGWDDAQLVSSYPESHLYA